MRNTRRIFIWMIAAIFCITAILKIVGLVTGKAGAEKPDPLFPFLSVQATIGIAAGLESLCVAVCLFNRSEVIKLVSIAWLSLIFLGYRAGLHATGQNPSCACLGYLHLGAPRITNMILELLVYFVILAAIGSSLFLCEMALNRFRATVPRKFRKSFGLNDNASV